MSTRIMIQTLCSFLLFLAIISFAQPQLQIISRHIPCPYFDGIRTNGLINVEVIAGSAKENVEVIGEPSALKTFKYRVEGQTLSLFVPPTSALTVKIKLNDLSEIIHEGPGNFVVIGKPIHLMTLNHSSSGLLKIYWVDSQALAMHVSGGGTVALAGVAGIVNVDLFHQAHADLRYLRANTVFVKTHQHAVADVYPLVNLFALAVDHSDIYFYHKPRYSNQTMWQSGSVLDMHDVPKALLTFNGSP